MKGCIGEKLYAMQQAGKFDLFEGHEGLRQFDMAIKGHGDRYTIYAEVLSELDIDPQHDDVAAMFAFVYDERGAVVSWELHLSVVYMDTESIRLREDYALICSQIEAWIMQTGISPSIILNGGVLPGSPALVGESHADL